MVYGSARGFFRELCMAAMDRAIGLWQDGRKARALDSDGRVVWDSKDAALWQIIGPLIVGMEVGRVKSLCLALRALDVPSSDAVGIVEDMIGKRMEIDEFNRRVMKAKRRMEG